MAKGESKSSIDKHPWITSFLIVCGIILVVAVILLVSRGSLTGKVIGPVCRDVQVPYEEQEEYLKEEYYTETVPYTDTVCESKEIPYAIDNFVLNYDTCNEYNDVCNKYVLGICIDKTTFCVDRSISCSLDLRNLDEEEGGVWDIEFYFYEVGRETIKTDEASSYLYPQTEKTFTGSIRIVSEGEEGDANKDLTCGYRRNKIPTKQVCRDVTKYSDVQRVRQVTAYKPVTRYRTETHCD